jgi:cytochrome bd ubiquinol oxidase subunit II
MNLDLSLAWACVVTVAIFVYVVMDGFDLGVGTLFVTVRGRGPRDIMVNSVAPVWDGNDTWLLFGGGGLIAVVPSAYSRLLSPLYMPLTCMLLALVIRSVALEMRLCARTGREQLIWNRAFQWGSVAASFCQGIALGALVQTVMVSGRVRAGGWWNSLSPFSLLTGLALTTGYGLLGACWLVLKTEGELQTHFRKMAAHLGWGTVASIGAVSTSMMILSVQSRSR